MWCFYIPVAVYLIFLTLRYRGLAFLASNPGFRCGGVIGDNKSLALAQLQQSYPQYTAMFELIRLDQTIQLRISQAEDFMRLHGLTYPVVLKPNLGQRGQGVAVIRDSQSLKHYLRVAEEDIVIQQHISGLEFGVFYYRLPEHETGELLSITEKQFPSLQGDGHSTLEELILQDPRTHYMAHYLLDLHRRNLGDILPLGQHFTTVEIGSHCRGSLFLDGNHLQSAELLACFDGLSSAVSGFHFGRYDVRVPSLDDFQQGKNIKILELNGVTSEATHIYDPKHSVFYAYKTLFEQWRIAYAIGAHNIRNGAQRISLVQLVGFLREYYRSSNNKAAGEAQQLCTSSSADMIKSDTDHS